MTKRNTGYHNTGNCNTGNRNTGYHNTGNWNTGSWNTGNCNTGSWNTTSHATGYFNTTEGHTIRVFNKPIIQSKWDAAHLPDFLYFDLTEWINSENMTDAEKADHPEHQKAGGYLREYSYKEAFQKSWQDADPEDRERIWDIPGFDPDIFYEISGIDVRENVKELTVADVSRLLGYEVKIVKY